MKTMDPKTRFSNRVEHYIRYRPRYPEEVIRILEKEFGLTDESVIADQEVDAVVNAALVQKVARFAPKG